MSIVLPFSSVFQFMNGVPQRLLSYKETRISFIYLTFSLINDLNISKKKKIKKTIIIKIELCIFSKSD